MRRLITAILIIGLIAGGLWTYNYFNRLEPSNDIVLFGNVDVRQVDIGFRVSGRVTSMPFQEGDLVTQGALMGELDQQPYADQVAQALANLESTRTNLAYSEKVFKRRKALLEVGDGSVSQEDVENTQANYEALTASLKQFEAALGVAQTNLKDTQVFAPSDGIILTRIREPGSVVLQSVPVYTLSLTSPVWIRAFIPEPLLGVVHFGVEAEIFTDQKGGRVYKGHVGFISPVAEFTPKTVETKQLRTDLVYRLRIIAENPDRFLLQGMPVTVKLYPKKMPHNEQ